MQLVVVFELDTGKNFKSRRAAILDSISSPGCDCLLRLSLGPGDLRDMCFR